MDDTILYQSYRSTLMYYFMFMATFTKALYLEYAYLNNEEFENSWSSFD